MAGYLSTVLENSLKTIFNFFMCLYLYHFGDCLTLNLLFSTLSSVFYIFFPPLSYLCIFLLCLSKLITHSFGNDCPLKSCAIVLKFLLSLFSNLIDHCFKILLLEWGFFFFLVAFLSLHLSFPIMFFSHRRLIPVTSRLKTTIKVYLFRKYKFQSI